MIGILTDKIVNYYEDQELFENHDVELVKYGLFLLITHIQYLIICLGFGLIFKCVTESIVFFVCFSILRMFCGGFHASTETRCFIISFIAIATSTYFIFLFEKHNYCWFLIVLTFISIILTLLLSPVDNKNKPLTKEEKRKMHKYVFLIIIVYSTLIILFFKKFYNLSVSIAISLTISSLFLIIGKIKQYLPN